LALELFGFALAVGCMAVGLWLLREGAVGIAQQHHAPDPMNAFRCIWMAAAGDDERSKDQQMHALQIPGV
jgi:hypothetical protein